MNEMTNDGWWQRNWKWFVPTLALTIVAFVGTAIVGLVFLVFGMIKSSEVYVEALARAQAHPVVQHQLGLPIEDGWMVMGNISTSGGSGEADLTIPISGPRGQARIFAVATRSAGQWRFDHLVVVFDGSEERLDLLADPRK